ncbi:MAG: hypothetical protein RMJ67_01280 [Elusimicrobiota bacterium]|nr:hypothetical protein [Endomicrobiia bacterium]MDW8165136.1 hypothetical protein [Elusimicrobiota bacterium]
MIHNYNIEIYVKDENNKKYVAVILDSDIDIEIIALMFETTLEVLKKYTNQIDNAIIRGAVNTLLGVLKNTDMSKIGAQVIKEVLKQNDNKLTYVSKDGRIICNFIYKGE